jgi:DNA-binding CsgD family transcriptional regulator
MADHARGKSGINSAICRESLSQLFGREAERTRIEELLARASGGPVGIALEGAPGIGKTTVWRNATERARVLGYRVLVAAPSEPDRTLAFSGLGDLFESLGDELFDRLPDPQRRALRAALFLDDAGEVPADLDALPRAVFGVLRQLAVDATVVVAIDDEQWLDRSSARVLAFALRRIREEPICLLLSRRAGSNGPLWSEVKDAFGPGIERIKLEGVDVATTQCLLGGLLGSKLSRRLLERVHQVSGGNPLYALALGAELKRSGGAGDPRELRIPSTLADAIAQRLGRVRAGVEAPLFAIAALAAPRVGLLGAALEGFDVRDLDEAVRAGVIERAGERIGFTHPLLASVHYASVPVSERRELHLRLAAAVPDAEERALHLALGTETPDGDVAREIERAAELAARRGAPEAAAELLEHAIRLTPADHRSARWARTTSAADQHYAAGEFERVRELLEELLLEQPDGPTSARARLRLALVRRDDFEFATSMLDQALVDAGDDDRLIIAIERVRIEWSGANLGDYAGTVAHAEAAVASAERLGEPGPLASALVQLGASLWYRGQGIPRELFERAMELERGADESIPAYYLASAGYGALLRAENDLDTARPLLERAVERARRRGEESGDLTPLLVRLAYLELDAGNRAASERWLAEATEAAGQQMNEEMDSWLADLRGHIAANQGQLEQAGLHAQEVLSLAIGSGDVQMQRDAEVLLANIELWGGEPESAHRRLQPWRERTIATGPWYVGWILLPLWSSDIEALIALDRLDEAQQVLDDLLERALPYPNPHGVAIAKRCEGLLLAARGELAGAIETMDAALAQHAQRPVPLEIGRTLLEKGSIERRAKRKTAAKRTLEQALATLEPLDAAIWVARARDELGRIGMRHAAKAEGLTPAQQRVAELAAGGATNREIAHTLYMSERTVESHLTKVYSQLEIRSRAQLATALAARASVGTAGGVPDTAALERANLPQP